MTSWNTIQNELKELNSSLPSERVPETYRVPQGYFENFASFVLQRIKNEAISAEEELKMLSPVLAGLSKQTPFSVPEGYFNNLSGDIPAIITEEQLPAVLLQAGKEMPFQMPAGYFDGLAGEILQKVQPARPMAKVVSLNSGKWMRYAVAAMVAGIIAVSSIFYLNGKTTDSSTQSEDWIARQLKNISDQELDAFIINADANNTTLAQNKGTGKTEIRSLLKDVPDSELEKFLNEVPFDNEDLSEVN
jgi:hypothetical protein